METYNVKKERENENSRIISVWVAFGVAALIAIVCIIVLIIILVNLINSDQAFYGAVRNTNQCSLEPFKCKRLSLSPPIPSSWLTTFQPSNAIFLAQLVAYLEYACYDGVNTWDTLGLTLNQILDSNLDSIPTIGYIATNQNTAFIIFRGTLTNQEWTYDWNYYQSPNTLTQFCSQALIHSGFQQLFTQFQQVLLQTINSLQPKQIVISGHSLGGALASLSAFVLNISIPIYVYTFGKPRVGNVTYHDCFQNSPITFFRVENTDDLVPQLPLSVTPNNSNPNQPWIYQHEGQSVPYEFNWGSFTLNHSLVNYVTWLETLIVTSSSQ